MEEQARGGISGVSAEKLGQALWTNMRPMARDPGKGDANVKRTQHRNSVCIVTRSEEL